jgi:hypothetical protein
LSPLPKKKNKKRVVPSISSCSTLCIIAFFLTKFVWSYQTKANPSYDERFTLGFTKDGVIYKQKHLHHMPFVWCMCSHKMCQSNKLPKWEFMGFKRLKGDVYIFFGWEHGQKKTLKSTSKKQCMIFKANPQQNACYGLV